MRLKDALNEKKMDVRLIDKYLAEGNITKEEVEAYRQKLEDDSSRFEYMELDREGASSENSASNES